MDFSKFPIHSYEEIRMNQWLSLPLAERERIIKYITLVKRNQKRELSDEHKNWVIKNCDCDTDAIPEQILNEKSLWLG